MQSVIQSEKECFLCREQLGVSNVQNLHEHHIFGGNANRKLSEKYGLKVYLCYYHHNDPWSKDAVHNNSSNMNFLRRIGQQAFEDKYGHYDFMKTFGKNYL